MEISRALVLVIVLVFLVVDSSWAESKVAENGKIDTDPNSKSNNSSNEPSLGTKPVTDDDRQKEKPKEKQEGVVNEVNKPKKDVNIQAGDKETGKGDDRKETKDGQSNNESLNGGKESKQEEVNRKKDQGGGKKEISHGEECDPSNRCFIEDSKLVACIRVTGNDSPDLSLLVQNDGEVPVSVTILSPDFVHLEKKSIQLQQKENKKVKVSISGKGSDSSIVLKTGSSSCSLNIKDLIDHHLGDDMDNSGGSTYSTTSRNRLPLLVACSVGLLVVASGCWLGMAIWRKKKKLANVSSSSSKYQRLDMELPVSGKGKKTTQSDDGWDNSWGDGWDDDDGGDEEMPKTPSSMPVTPSLSSKGLASRSRLSKDGWKD